MIWVFLMVGAVLVVAIAFVAVGRVTSQLAAERPPAVYELAAAVDWIAERLPDEVTARLSYDNVGRILAWHLDWFGSVGVSSKHGQELAGSGVLHEGAVAIESAAVDAVVARAVAEAESSDDPESVPDAVDVVCVLDLQMAYLQEIGAVGEVAAESSDTAGGDVVD